MDWQAKWIWSRGEKSPRNYYLCSRKEFDLDSFTKAELHITADSRYSAWINGEYIGFGPVRAFTQTWRYDTYDITPYLKPGKNAVAVLVQHYGLGTFQYLDSPGGLRAQIDIDGKVAAKTDSTWKVTEHQSYMRRVPRMACQQAWTEVFDARSEPTGWREPGFDDSKWDNPIEIDGAVWGNLLPRDIPFLTDLAVHPTRIMESHTVKPPKQVWSMNVRSIMLPDEKTANPAAMTGLIITVLSCSEKTKAAIKPFVSCCEALRLDGRDIDKADAANGIEIQSGEHLLIADISIPYYHDSNLTLLIEGKGITLKSPLGDDALTPFAFVSSFESKDAPAFINAWQTKTAADIAVIPEVKAVNPDDMYDVNVLALTDNEIDTGNRVHISNPEAMLSPNENSAVIFPSIDGDTEFLIDFGRMTVGFLEMSLNAPEGTIFDFNGFEYISGDKAQPTLSLHNTFRYVAREGWQNWRSVIRRGVRYAKLVVRFPEGCAASAQIKKICCNEHVYPYTERGEFHCSDYKLNKIWDISRLTVRLCSEDTFVDCPTYEQTFWVGDARNESLFAYTGFGDYKLARRCLLLAGESLWRSPIVESQVPSGWEDILPAWSLLWAIGCQEHYQFSGDKSFLEEVYPAIRKQNFNIREMFTNSDGLFELEDAWNLLDWAPMDTPRTGVVTHQNMLQVLALRRSAKVAEVLGKTDDAELYRKWADELKSAINKHLWEESKQAYIDCIHDDGSRSTVISQQTQTIAYLCDIVPKDKSDLFAKYLTDVPEGWVTIGSPFMMAFTLEALDKAGDVGRAIELVRKWWGMMINDDATTCWETFPGWFGEWPARSHCHAWSAAPAFILPTCVLGVRPIDPGFAKFEVRPYLGDLEWAKGRVPTPHGEIIIGLRRQDHKTAINIIVPEGTVALVGKKEYSAGRHAIAI